MFSEKFVPNHVVEQVDVIPKDYAQIIISGNLHSVLEHYTIKSKIKEKEERDAEN